MTKPPRNAPPVPITTQMRQSFKRDAPAALARRNDAYLLGVAANVAQWLLIGGLGLLGLYRWQWTAGEMLLLFVGGIVASMLADSLKWLFARGTMRAEYRKMQSDRLVWAMLDADARQATSIAAERLQPKAPGPALAIDLVFGALGGWWMSTQLAAFGLEVRSWQELASGLRWALIVVFAMPLLSMLAATIAHRRVEGGYDDLEFRAGGRGIGLILLAGALAFFAEGETGARDVMLFVHWATVVAGVMSIAGVAIMLNERNALREQLAAERESPAERRPRTDAKRTRRRGRSR